MKIVRVLWQDAQSDDGWNDKEKMDKWAKEPLPLCDTVGWLHSESDDTILVIGTTSPDEYMHCLKIPKAWITKMEILKETG